MRKLAFAAIGMMAFLIACKKTDQGNTPPTPETVIAPDGFNFTTSKEISLNVRLLTNDNKPIPGVLVNVYTINNDSSALFTTISDANGYAKGSIVIPAYVDSLVIDPAYVGLMRNAAAVVKNNAINGTIGGSLVFDGDIVPNKRANNRFANSPFSVTGTTGTTVYSYLNTYDNSGRPNNLVSPADVISSQLLSFINTSLPEQRPVPTYHPDFLTESAETNINVNKIADVWITFVHEGAGYMNSMGFYTYPTNNPPLTQNNIDSIKIIIPNASLLGSSGNMRSGDKILLGRYEPGTSIGFVLLQNAWNSSTKTVKTNTTKFFSDDALNNETTNYKRHTVLLHDATNQLFLQGFEDLQRDNNSSDNDFNDLIFYVTTNPVDAVITSQVNPIDTPTDTDNDGVTDVYDKFPTNPALAYIQHFPSQQTWGTLAFEDLWPSVGDYDMNDLVVGYQYKFLKNALNKTVKIEGSYVIRAVGATKKSGFGVEFPFLQNKVTAVTGQKLTANYINVNGNGTEAQQAKAVVIPFDDQKNLVSGLYINTIAGLGYATSDTAHVAITLSTPLTNAELGNAPFNPFLISNQQRGLEVHLPGSKPTSLANTAIFGTFNDHSSITNNKFYQSKANWPWALSFLEEFNYPVETNNISTVYNHFLRWAETGGASNTEWYKNNAGNRNPIKVYAR